MRKARGYLLVLVGLVAIGTAAMALLGPEVSFGSKYNPAGRDSGALTLLLLIGICAFAGGVFDVFLASGRRSGPHSVGADVSGRADR